jgi:hypothetical protein
MIRDQLKQLEIDLWSAADNLAIQFPSGMADELKGADQSSP